MSLSAALERRGYSFRQHLEEEGWTRRKPTAVDLDGPQRVAFERGGIEGLKAVLAEQGLWTFPAMDIEKPLPIRADLILVRDGRPTATVVAPGSSGSLRQMACELIEAVRQRSGVTLDLQDGDRAGLALLASQSVVLFGGSHEGRFAMDLAMRYQAGFVDATTPGEDGWVVTTHAGLDGADHNVLQVAASPSCAGEAMACALERLATEGDCVLIRAVHRIRQGHAMRERFPSWEALVAGLSGRIPRFQGQSIRAPLDPIPLADLLAQGLDSGGPEVNWYNAAPIDIAVQGAQYYQRSGDRRGLELFREMLFRLADYYLKTPGGASYPADLDFRLGHVILYFSRLEHDPLFSEEDRLILANLLLACTRSIYEYTLKIWPLRPNEPTRHNHETFAARSLLFAADYFRRYGIRDVDLWRAHSDAVFSGGIWARFKQKENANHYEACAFDHAACYSAFTGRRLDLFDPDCLRMAAFRNVVTTDNFFRPVDYGDARVSMQPGDADRLATIVVSQRDDPTLQWFSEACFARQPGGLPSPLDCFTDVRRPYAGPGPQTGVWEELPLDPQFMAHFCPGFPRAYAFDKLAFRTGWGEEDHYLLFEGVGNLKVSHSHNELNGIVRLNHLGRHWVVSNGYGRRTGMTNINVSYNTRVRGPEDHNMLVLRRGGEVVRDLPVCCALLQRGQSGDLAYATGALIGYGGADWFRTVLILAGRFVLVLDRMHISAPGLEAGHVEWNCLGKATACEGGFRLEQEGVFMDVTSDSGWPGEVGVADQSADWKAVLEGGRYPYASFPLTRLTFRMPVVEGTCHLATLLAATRLPEAAYRVREPAPGRVRVEALHEDLPEIRVDYGDLSVRAGGRAMEVRFQETPEVPEALRTFTPG
ncbi:MAG: hypothetical protein EXS64_09790 [Candidatus Latescibacteria bacterium]|nr:hypothetical protein [Candidatus Latescibacterota bacterium]